MSSRLPIPPPEPDFDRPRPGAVASWARIRRASAPWEDTWVPIWTEPPDHGLALRLADINQLPHLAIVHTVSGYEVIGARVGGAPIRSNRAARAACRRAIAALLAGFTWAGTRDADDPGWWAAGSGGQALKGLLVRVQAEHLPAVPEWRAWRLGRHGLYSRWFTAEEAAVRWAAARRARWWAVEAWPVPPGGVFRAQMPPLRVLAEARAPLPPGMAELLWGAGGASHRRVREGLLTGSGDPWEGWP